MVDSLPPLVVVDAANVVGSVPDGWWKDRAAATERLRAALEPLPVAGISGSDVPAWAACPPLEVLLVVEGQARNVRGTAAVRVVAARGSGDDAIVDLLDAEVPEGRQCLVVTADRDLRERVRALGAEVIGPRCVYP